MNAIEAWAGTSDFSNMYRQFGKKSRKLSLQTLFFCFGIFKLGKSPQLGKNNFRISVQAGYLLIVLGQLNSYWLPPAFPITRITFQLIVLPCWIGLLHLCLSGVLPFGFLVY